MAELHLFGKVCDQAGPNFRHHDWDDWLYVTSQHRDSEALTRSNFRVAKQRLEAKARPETEDDESDVRVNNFGHWAVGWMDHLVVRPGTPAAEEAQEIVDALDTYPILDDDDLGQLEDEELDDEHTRGYHRGRQRRCADGVDGYINGCSRCYQVVERYERMQARKEAVA